APATQVLPLQIPPKVPHCALAVQVPPTQLPVQTPPRNVPQSALTLQVPLPSQVPPAVQAPPVPHSAAVIQTERVLHFLGVPVQAPSVPPHIALTALPAGPAHAPAVQVAP